RHRPPLLASQRPQQTNPSPATGALPMLDRVQSFYGFTRMPFGRDLALGMLHRYHDHAQATTRIAYGIDTRGITVITGEVGVGKTVAARAALDRVDRARPHLIYIPDPTVGARGVYPHILTPLGR